MKFSANSIRLFHWLHLPGAVLLALLQRTPAVRVVTTASEIILRSPAGALLKSAVAAVGSIGALHSMAGATTLSPSSPSPTSATVGTSKTVAFSAIGAQSAGESWVVGGSVPPGLTFNNGASSGTVNTPTGVLIMSGTPTTAGTYVLSLRAYEKPNAGGASSPLWSYTVVVTGGVAATAPSFTTHPATQTVTAGANVTFTVAATGSPTPTLQWRKNGVNISGQTGTSLTLSSVAVADGGSYTCVATNSVTSVTSNAATLTVNAATVAPAFSTHPTTQTVTAGANVTFTVAATGSPTPTLQWQKNGSNLAGQTGTSLTLSSVALADGGSYTCVATNSVTSVTSNAATLTVNAATVAPAFSTHPTSQTVTAGANVTFTVAATGSPTPTLQWQKNGSNLAGQTGTSLTLSSVAVADGGSYTCVATNSVTSVTSNAATLTVNAATVAPAFSTHPTSQTVTAGANVTFTVAATGSPTPTLQWQKNGSNLAGQTGPSLTLSSVAVADGGSYTCVATNSVTSVTSNAATLTVNAATIAPAFSTHPAVQTVPPGTNVTFTIVATGSPTPTLQWQKNGGNLAGQTGSSLTLNAVTAADAGSYSCVATNTAGTATSNAATLTLSTVAVAPAFTTQPTTQTVAAGTNVTFSVVATGSPTPTLQWEKNGGALAGQTGTSLTLTAVTATDAGSYTCTATNPSGTVTSSAATLTVSAVAPTFTTQPVGQSVNAGTNVTLTVVAAGSPVPTLQWQKNGSSLAGKTGASLALTNVQVADAGSYTCIATNTAGTATSSAAALAVNAVTVAPAFTTHPTSQTVNAGTTVTFAVVATGSPVPTLQWRKNGTVLAGQTGLSLVLPNVQSSDAGSYVCVATNTVSSATSNSATLTLNAVPVPNTPPAFTTQPVAQSVSAGATVTLTVAVTGSPTPTLQWLKDGSSLAGQNNASLTLTGIQSSDAGNYTCVATNSVGAVTSNAATVSVAAATGPDSRISNVSVRTTLAAAQTLIVGFTMQGGSKLVLVRAVGPGLANFGVTGTMSDPKLLLYKDATMLTQNDNWGGGGNLSTAFASVGAFPLTVTSLDAALMRTVEGGHTAQVTGPVGGNVLVEAYDAGTGVSPRLSNISARNFVGTGGDILIAGFTVAGTSPKNLLIRAVGPTLGVFGVPGTLNDPKLSIFNSAGVVIAENDTWNASLASVFSSVGAFALAPGSKDAAFTLTLPPGGYTVQVSGADGGTGEALVELYELP
ncbi:beta strand repeat-containing protein [Horticoccus sp. 23ND18S-11]|uniref:beta strand repeat-containing protein n=1 Tax=Horticoccus sp. 23ND18S-11 TaxID=3391832 RepID=UPI0039C8D8C8